MKTRLLLPLFLMLAPAGAYAQNTVGIEYTSSVGQNCVEGEGGNVSDFALTYGYGAELLDVSVVVPLDDGSCGGMVADEDRDRSIDFSLEKRIGNPNIYALVDIATGGADAFGVGSEPVLGAGAGFSVGPVQMEAALDFFSLTNIEHVLHDYQYGDHPFADDLAVYAEASLGLPFGTSLSVGGKCGLGNIKFGACKYTGSLGWSRSMTDSLQVGVSVDAVRYPNANHGDAFFDGEMRVGVTTGVRYSL